jgi:hypothetical protein
VGFRATRAGSIDADGERRVSGTDPVWFRNGGYGRSSTSAVKTAINRKFTPNRMIRIFREFSAI